VVAVGKIEPLVFDARVRPALPGYSNAIGLLFAGSALITIHNHIADVERALAVRPVTAPRSS